MSTATPSTNRQAADQAEILRTLDSLFHPGDVVELRILDARTRDDRRPHVESGYFTDWGALAEAAAGITAAKGWYVTINPVVPSLLARASNRIRAVVKEPTTSNPDILARRWLPIDLDAERPAGISASDAEHDAALQRALEVRDTLTAAGWPEPIYADSGNGAHLIYRVDLPADDGGLVERCLKALASRFNAMGGVKVDTTTHNPARIWKLYGTVACKGDHTAERPHRLARILYLPDQAQVVSTPMLEALASRVNVSGNGQRSRNGSFDLEAWIHNHGLGVRGPESWQGGTRWVFETCPWNPDHANGSAFIVQRANGLIGAGCHHNGCAGKGWHDLRDLVEPDRRDHREQTDDQAGYDPADDPRPEQPAGPGERNERLVFPRVTCAELDRTEYHTEYLIDGTLVDKQPCIIAGGKKSLKTSLIIDMGIALAMGGYFLGRLKVSRACRVGIMSGESGMGTIQETARRICLKAGYRLGDIGGLVFSEHLPQFENLTHLDALERFIMDDELEVLFIDPAYLCMAGGDAGNLFIQGATLRLVNEVCRKTGCTMVIAHHCKKGGKVNPFDPPELEDIAWAGFQEWARQWILVGRRERYEPGTGDHRLWLNVGGSAGHSALWALDVSEGVYDDHTPRRWDVTLLPATEAREDAAERKQTAQAEAAKLKAEAGAKAVVQVMTKIGRPETTSIIAEHAGMSYQRAKKALSSLWQDDHVRPVEVAKSNHKKPYQAWQLVIPNA